MTRNRHRMTATVLAVATAGAAVASIAAFVGSASGTPPVNEKTELLARGTITGGIKVRVDGIRLRAKGDVDLATAHLTFAPGGTTGWHVHPGPVLVIVKTGTVTKYSSDCSATSYTVGQAFVEHGPRDVTMVRNNGTTQAETIATFLSPVGASLREDVPAPNGCNP